MCLESEERTGSLLNTSVVFSSATDDWATPQAFFDQLYSEFHFTTDVCASKENAKCLHFYDVAQDGLKQEWSGVCWMNPPSGRTIGQWMEKAHTSAQSGKATVVCLVPAVPTLHGGTNTRLGVRSGS